MRVRRVGAWGRAGVVGASLVLVLVSGLIAPVAAGVSVGSTAGSTGEASYAAPVRLIPTESAFGLALSDDGITASQSHLLFDTSTGAGSSAALTYAGSLAPGATGEVSADASSILFAAQGSDVALGFEPADGYHHVYSRSIATGVVAAVSATGLTTSTGMRESRPAISRDGTVYAFVSEVFRSSGSSDYTVYLGREGSPPEPVSTDASGSPILSHLDIDLSANGRFLVYLNENRTVAYLRDNLTGNVTELPGWFPSQHYRHSVTDEGSVILEVLPPGMTQGPYLFSPISNSYAPLRIDEGGYRYEGMTISPNGRYIVERQLFDGMQLYVTVRDLVTGERIMVANYGGGATDVSPTSVDWPVVNNQGDVLAIAGNSSTTPLFFRRTGGSAQSNRQPAWQSPTPGDRSRFDLVPGSSASFTVAATDPDGDPVTIEPSFFEPDGDPRSQPSYVDCIPGVEPVGTATLTCTVSQPSGSGISLMRVDAVDSTGARAGLREFLTSVTPYTYLALGDSYSSGEGVDPFFQDGVNSRTGVQDGRTDNACHRSTQAYAEFVKPPGFSSPLYTIASGYGDSGSRGPKLNKYGSDANVRLAYDVRWVFLACSGAITTNVLPFELGGVIQNPQVGFRELYPQLSNPVITYGTDLVTITIGGNDAEFADTVAHCFYTPACATDGYKAEVFARIDGLRDRLALVNEAILSKTYNARVVVLGYPQLFPADPLEQACPELAGPFLGEMDFFREAATRLNNVVRLAAQDAGVDYVDVEQAFSHHEICGSHGAWINGVKFTATSKKKTIVDDQSFHPNVFGQAGYATVVNAWLVSNP